MTFTGSPYELRRACSIALAVSMDDPLAVLGKQLLIMTLLLIVQLIATAVALRCLRQRSIVDLPERSIAQKVDEEEKADGYDAEEETRQRDVDYLLYVAVLGCLLLCGALIV